MSYLSCLSYMFYWFDSSPGKYMTPEDGRQFCAQAYESELMVPNSRDEAAFIGGFLATLRVS
jgi:hypothetical protein